MKILVAGAGGFIGSHLVKFLVDKGHTVIGTDIVEPKWEPSPAHEFYLAELRSQMDYNWWDDETNTERNGETNIEQVYQLAADMGGVGEITAYHARIARNNILINTGMLDAGKTMGVSSFLFSSSACVYPQYRQLDSNIDGLKEEYAYPADPEEGYGWEKLFTEKLVQYYHEDYGLNTHIVRLHNVFGPLGTYEGGREKAPAALCRKIALAKDEDEIEVWGDGNQTRSFLYIDDCVKGLYAAMNANYNGPINIGSEELVTVNELVDMIAKIAGKSIRKRYDTTKPQGVRGRNSDSSLALKVLGWSPKVPLEVGLERTYRWIYNQIKERR